MERIYLMSEDDFLLLEDVWERLAKQFSLVIAPYRNTPISPGQTENVHKFIVENMNSWMEIEGDGFKCLNQFVQALQGAIDSNKWLELTVND